MPYVAIFANSNKSLNEALDKTLRDKKLFVTNYGRFMGKRMLTVYTESEPEDFRTQLGSIGDKVSVIGERMVTKQVVKNMRYGIDFAKNRYHVEIKPDLFIEAHCNSEEMAIKLVEEQGYSAISVYMDFKGS